LSLGDFDAATARQICVRARAKHDQTKAVAALNIVAALNPANDPARYYTRDLHNSHRAALIIDEF
jgi:hypothetical protein